MAERQSAKFGGSDSRSPEVPTAAAGCSHLTQSLNVQNNGQISVQEVLRDQSTSRRCGTRTSRASFRGSVRLPDNIDRSKSQQLEESVEEVPPEPEPPSFPLTIDNLVKPELNRHSTPSCAVTIIKWIVTFLVTGGLTACVVTSKITLLKLATALNSSTASSTNTLNAKGTDETKTIVFFMLVLALLIPYVLTFLRAFSSGGFRRDMPWPSKRAMFWGVLSSLLESFGIFLLVLQVFQTCHLSMSVLLMNAVYIIPILCNLVASCRNRGQRTKWMIMYLLAGVFEIAGLATVFVVVYWYPSQAIDMKTSWQMPVAIVCLSVAWSPYVQRTQIDAPSGENRGGYQLMGGNLPTGGTAVNAKDDHSENQTYKHTARWKSSIITSFLKFIFIGAFVFGLSEPLDYFHFDSFDLGGDWESTGYLGVFIGNVISSVAGYLLAYLACSMCMYRAAFIVPLFLVTPVTLVTVTVYPICTAFIPELDCRMSELQTADSTYIALFIASAVCLFLGQIFCSESFGITSEYIVLQKESEVFWTPNYNGVLLEQWLLLGRRKKEREDRVDRRERARNSRVYVCTTMFRETEIEMRQLLESIDRINLAQQEGERYFQSHVFFDGGVKHSKPSRYAMKLIALLHKTLRVTPHQCTKIMTPYGMTLSWKLPTEFQGQREMLFSIHLKDNSKVKNKKRWSQVMYMSYILDFVLKQDESNDHENFILTTDADVMFTPESVEALLDLLTRDPSVGAVCARTHPLGNGPVVWYQIFDYAVGHWLQKATEHVLGSVLCSPGCFSAYRCAAIRSVLPTYATNVDQAFDFLIKDMGEDRWFCTLMVQAGWRIEYCAASENSTHCPEDFEEFYKQRRRWIASTIANLMLLINEWKIIQASNHGISFLFIVYQALLLFSTLIGPATVILIVSGGVQYAWGVSAIAITVLQVLVCLIYTFTCLYKSQDLQLLIAKLLTFIYAVIMTAVTVGTAVQVAEDISNRYGTANNHTTAKPLSDQVNLWMATTTQTIVSDPLPISVTTMYLAGLVGVFVVCALLHLREAFCLLHGVWYLLCLPSGYLVLNIYSICNLTDRSWGTREEKEISAGADEISWKAWLRKSWKSVWFCWYDDDIPTKESKAVQTSTQSTDDGLIPDETDGEAVHSQHTNEHKHKPGSYKSRTFEGDETVDDRTRPVEEWLQGDFREQYKDKFKANGYDDTTFICGMTTKDLREVGVNKSGHLQHLLGLIANLPEYDIDVDVPRKADVWLKQIGLSSYRENFQRNGIKTKKDMEVLKSMKLREIKADLGITKIGHLKRLMLAIERLRKPTEAEGQIIEIRTAIEQAKTYQLEVVNPEENHFWTELRRKRLEPDSQAFGLENQLKDKLSSLRNSWLMVLAISNTLWIITILTLASHALLNVLNSNPLGFSFLVVFGLILIIQFFAMIVHRFSTLVHFLARAPYRFGKDYQYNWAFRDTAVWPGHGEGPHARNVEVLRENNIESDSGFASGNVGTNARYQSFRPQIRQSQTVQFQETVPSDERTPLLQKESNQVL